MKRILQYWRFVIRSHGRAVVFVAFVSVAQLAFLAPVLSLVRALFDRHIPAKDGVAVFWCVAGIVLLQVASSLLLMGSRRVALRTSRALLAELRRELVDHLLVLPRSVTASAERGILHHRLVYDTDRVDAMTNVLLSYWAPSLVVILTLSAIIIWLNWIFFVLLAALSPFVVLHQWYFKGRIRSRYSDYHKAVERYSSAAMFLAGGLDLVRVQTAEDAERETQRQRIRDLEESGFQAGWQDSLAGYWQNIIAVVATGSILMVGGLLVVNGRLTVGQLMSVYFAIGLLQARVQLLLSQYSFLVSGLQSLQSVDEILDLSKGQPYKGRRKIDFTGRVTFQSVTFGYGAEPVIRDVSLTLEPGRVTALLGPNGTGKTTLLHLTCGFYRPQQGRILADDVAYDELAMESLRSRIGVVMQEPMLFEGTILDNILYGHSGAGIEVAREAAAMSLANEFIDLLPDGYDTRIGDRGALLSGGQRQRIAIARALARRPRLLILDEPTTHLDRRATKNLLDRLADLPDHPAILVITHDAELLQQAAVAYAIDDQGTLQERRHLVP